MKTPKMFRPKMLWMVAMVIAVGCAQNSSLDKMGRYQNQSRSTLESYARGVSGSFVSRQSRQRRFLDASQSFGSGELVQGNLFNPNLNLDTYDCFEQVQGIEVRRENYIPMVAKFSQCLNRMLVEGNPVMSYGYRNLDPMGQNYYAYLLNWRRFGTLDSFSSNDFGVLSQFAGNGHWPIGNTGFGLTPQ